MYDSISVIIPALNEEVRIAETIQRVKLAPVEEVILVDGGSSDQTVPIAESLGARIMQTTANRGVQQNLGAQHAKGTILLFLHADTLMPYGFTEHITTALGIPGVCAGAFQFHLDAPGWKMRMVEQLVKLRCRTLQLPYGDQAIFMFRETFERVGRFSEFPVMEDFDLVCRLQKLGRVVLTNSPAVTSARRWQQEGILKLTWFHQLCVLGYYLRIPPERLVRFRSPAIRSWPKVQ